jgi:hypothetical protein
MSRSRALATTISPPSTAARPISTARATAYILSAEELPESQGGIVPRRPIGLVGRRQRFLQTEHGSDVALGFLRLDQLPDGSQRVAPPEHPQHELQPGP